MQVLWIRLRVAWILFYLFNVARLWLSMYLGKRSRYIRSVSTIPKCPVVSRDEDTKADGWWTLKIGKDDGAIQERFPWCPAPELFWTFHKYIRTIETFATERNPAQVYPMFRWREYLAEITDPESLIRCIFVRVRVVSKSAADMSVWCAGQDVVMAFVIIGHM